MRDKVKRFISILMTALMLVNLMPVGALADGITSIGYKPEVAASTGNHTVYVYARFDGDPLPGVTLNASQWYTIGYIANVNLPSPGGISWGQYWYYNNNNYCGSTINSTSASGIIGGLVQEYNTSIVIKSDEWISANFKACPGADTYKEGTSEPTWHLDIIVDINKNPPVYNLVFKVNNSNGKQIGTPKKVTGRWTNPLSANKYYAGNPVPETIIDGGRKYQLKTKREGNPNLDTKIYFNEPIKNVEFYYKEIGPVTRDYTVNYYLNGTEEKVKTSTTGTKELGETVTPDTNVSGYTLVPDQKTSLTIVDGDNVLNLYYYKNVELTANSDTVPYNGQEQEVSGFTGAPKDADFSEIKVGAKGTDVGTYTAAFADGTVDTVDATGKYIVTKAINGTLKITPVTDKVVVTITGHNDTVTYNGSEQSVEGYDVSISAPEGVSYTAADFSFSGTAKAAGTNVGTYPMGLNADQFANTNGNFENVTFNVTDGWLKIDPLSEVVVTITGHNDTVTYNGSEQSVEGYDVSISAPEGVNYTEADFSFNGTAKAAGTNVGTYPMGLKASDFANTNGNFSNVEFVVVDGKLEISKRSVTLTSGSAERVYNGEALTNETVTVGGDGFATGEGVTYDFTGSQTDVGESENTFTFEANEGTSAKNYSFEFKFGTLKVTPFTDKVTVTITEKSGTATYDGKEHIVSGYESMTADNPLYDEDSVEENPTVMWAAKGTNVGEYPVGIVAGDFKNTNANFTNVEFVVVDGALEITPAPVTLQAPIASKTYDGTPLEATQFGHSYLEGLDFADDFASVILTGSQTLVGSSASLITGLYPMKARS
ncbi:MAG: MBG domain-containing protein [Christensenellales bacterium]